MIRLIACDLDETLLDDDKHISIENKEAIMKAKQLGVMFVPASGRGITGIYNVQKQLDVYQKEGEYTISNNGGIVVENKGDRLVSFHAFPYEQALALFRFGIEKDICIEVFTQQDVYAYHLNDFEREWLFRFKEDAIVCEEDSIAHIKEEPIVKILFEHEDMEVLYTLEKEMKEISQDIASISYSSNRYMEINPLGVDKGSALKELAQYLQIPMHQVMAIGDNHNDISMLKAAGISVAVGNANEEIKKMVTYVTQATYKTHAVKEAIETYVLCEEVKG